MRYHRGMTLAGDLNVDSLLLIVVGSHLRAEIDDRPLAYRFCARIAAMMDERRNSDKSLDAAPLTPIVCTDVWFLNNQELLERPVIALGEPGVNAATAYLCNRLPTALIVDNTLRIHVDPQFSAIQACVWGVNANATASAIDLFIERYLDDFVHEAIGA